MVIFREYIGFIIGNGFADGDEGTTILSAPVIRHTDRGFGGTIGILNLSFFQEIIDIFLFQYISAANKGMYRVKPFAPV